MAYSEFTIAQVRKKFSLTIQPISLFEKITPQPLPKWLQEMLEHTGSMAFVSEKARSEFLIAPILLALTTFHPNHLAVYSGQRLDVDKEQGLVGECDFILTKTPSLPVLESPIITLVEAKKNDVEVGIGQCIAQMVGASLFNREAGYEHPIFGCVTTGETWQFLKLDGNTIFFDQNRYYLNEVDVILGILESIVASFA